MATPDGFIEISDFTPGIWGDFHASKSTQPMSASALDGAILGNGQATVENTYRCRADKTGALIPLPKPVVALTSTAIPISGTYVDDNDYVPSDRAAAYVLDAEIGPQVSLVAEADAFLGPKGPESIAVMWGFWFDRDGNGSVNGYSWYVLGREYRPWSAVNVLADFLIMRSANKIPGSKQVGLPVGQLVVTPYAYLLESDPTAVYPVNPVFVFLASGPAPYGNDANKVAGNAPALTTLEKSICTQTRTFGTGVLIPSFSYFHPTADSQASFQSFVMGMSGWVFPPFPDQDNLWALHYKESTWTSAVPRSGNPYIMTAHQGRVVWQQQHNAVGGGSSYFIYREVDAAGASKNVYFAQDLTRYSPYGIPLGIPISTASPTVYGHYPSGYEYPRHSQVFFAEDINSLSGTIGTVTNDQMLIVKHRGGGVLVSGDLDNPTVRRMPGMASTHGAVSRGAQTPLGFVYGSKLGVFAWRGGDKSEKLSQQIDGFFWDHTNGTAKETYAGSRGRFCYWNGLICVPNSYAMDTETGGWWRFAHPTTVPYNVYGESQDGTLYAFPYKLTSTQNVVAYTYAQDVLDSTYSWQSHPLVESRGRTVSLQDVRLLATGNDPTGSTITVTITGFDVDGTAVSQDVVFTMGASEEPQMLRKDLTPNFQAEYIQVRIVATASSTGWAPKIHSLRFGTKERATTRRAG